MMGTFGSIAGSGAGRHPLDAIPQRHSSAPNSLPLKNGGDFVCPLILGAVANVITHNKLRKGENAKNAFQQYPARFDPSTALGSHRNTPSVDDFHVHQMQWIKARYGMRSLPSIPQGDVHLRLFVGTDHIITAFAALRTISTGNSTMGAYRGFWLVFVSYQRSRPSAR